MYSTADDSFNIYSKILTGIDDSIKFISKICSLYFDISYETLLNILYKYYTHPVEQFIYQDGSNNPLIIYFNFEFNNELVELDGVNYRILVSDCFDQNISGNFDCIGFYRYSIAIDSISNDNYNTKKFDENEYTRNFILLPIFSNNLFPLNLSLISYLDTLLLPISIKNCELDGKECCEKYKYLFEKFNEISNIVNSSNNSQIENVNLVMCKSLLSFVNQSTNCLDNYKIKIEDELILEDIKSNVREWSTEIVRVIREYSTKFTDDFDDEDELSLSETTSEYNSDTSSDTTSSEYENTFFNSFLTLKTSKMKSINTGIVDDISKYIKDICSNTINLNDEFSFWKSYKKVIEDLNHKMNSENFLNTLLLLEYNGVSVENIYSFSESKEMVNRIFRDVNEIDKFLSDIKVIYLIKCDKLLDVDCVIERLFITIRKNKTIKYFKNARFISLYNGLISWIINSISRIISNDLKNEDMRENNNIIMKVMKVVYDFKNRIISLNTFFERNCMQIAASEQSPLIFLDVFKNVMELLYKCNYKFHSLYDEVDKIFSYLSDEEDDVSISDDSKSIKVFNQISKIKLEILESYNEFISALISHYQKSTKNMENILNLDSVIIDTKYKIDNHEDTFLETLKNLINNLTLFEVLPIVKIINSFNTPKKYSSFSYEMEKYLDEILEEYDKIIYDIDNPNDQFLYYPLNKCSNKAFNTLVIKERIINLLDIIDVINKLLSKSILKTTEVNLNALLKEYTDRPFNTLDEDSINVDIEFSKKNDYYFLSLNLDIDYQEQMINLSLNNSIINEDYKELMSLIYLVDYLFQFNNLVNNEKLIRIDHSEFVNQPYLKIFNHLIESVEDAVKENGSCLINKGILNDGFHKLVESLYGYVDISVSIFTIYQKLKYLMEYEGDTNSYKNELFAMLSQCNKTNEYIKCYTNIEINKVDIGNILMNILVKYVEHVAEEWARNNIYTSTINEYCKVHFNYDGNELTLYPTIDDIRKKYYNQITSIINECYEIFNTLKPKYVIDEDICFSSLLSKYVKLIEETLMNVEKEFQHWSMLLSEYKVNIINFYPEDKDFIKIINELNDIIISTNDFQETKVVGFVSINLPKQSYVNKLKQIRSQTLKDIEEIYIEKSYEFFLLLKKHCDNIGLKVSESMFRSKIITGFENECEQLQIILDVDLLTINKYISLFQGGTDNEICVGNLSFDTLAFFDHYMDTMFNYIGSICESLISRKGWQDYISHIKSLEKAFKSSDYILSNHWFYSYSFNKLLSDINKETEKFINTGPCEKLINVFDLFDNFYSNRIDNFKKEWDIIKFSMFDVKLDPNEVINKITHIEDNYNMLIKVKRMINKSKFMLNSIITNEFDNILQETEDYVSEEIEQYKEKYMSYKILVEYYQRLLQYDIFVPLNTVLTEISNIKTVKVDQSLSNNIRNDVDLIEKIYTEYINIVEDNSCTTKKLTSIIKNYNFKENEECMNISHLLNAYKENTKELESFFEYEKNIHKINIYFIELNQNFRNIYIEFRYDIKDYELTDDIRSYKLYYIYNIDFIIKFLDDNITKLSVIKTSNYNDQFYRDSSKWIEALFKVKGFVEGFVPFSDKMNKYLNIISSKLGNSVDYIEKLDTLNCYLEKIITIQKLNSIDESRLSLLSSLIETVDCLEKMINSYLNNVRFECPRLYFIDDSDLVEIIGGEDIDRFLFKIFPGISSLERNNNKISGIISSEFESIKFDDIIEYKNNENVNFINALESSINTSLKKSFTSAFDELNSHYSVYSFDDEIFLEWIKSYPVQILTLTLSICWTKSMENCNSSSDLIAIKNYISKMIEFIIMNMNSDYLKSKMYQLFLTLDYQLMKIVEIGFEIKSSLKWLQCIKYYHENEVVLLKIMFKSFEYRLEYLFNRQKMIITDITESFYSFASLTLNCNLLPSAQGPAGTGKTETIKSLSYLSGSNMMVFNFSELYEVEDVEKILSGLCLLGYWGIFDEFNRLSECVLSSVTEKIEKICNKNNKEIILLDKSIEINDNTTCFMTMNPHYSGRSELPLNCVHLCQPFVMEKVDLISIIQVNLQLNRFENYLNLSKKIISIIDSLSLLFSSIKFDFGLRFIKYIFNFITYLNRSNEKFTPESIFFESLHRLLYPRLSCYEIKLYKNFVSDNYSSKYSDDEQTFISELKGMLDDEYMIEKVIQIHNMVTVSSSIILLGNSYSGKSYAFGKFVEYMRLKNKIEIVAFDPNSVDNTKLFGCRVEDKWLEGLIPFLLKSIKNNYMFILFDGDVRQNWVENLNSLLDDNKILTLSNGERITLGDNIKIFFETDTLTNITPATVSRSTIVYFEGKYKMNNIDNNGNDDQIINSLIEKSQSFTIKYSPSSGLTSYVKGLMKNFELSTIYLSKGMDANDLINYLYSICELNQMTNVLTPKSKSVILIKDIYILSNRNVCVSLYSTFRQIIKYNFIYNYNNKKLKWEKIYLNGIIFIFFQPTEFKNNCRLLSILPIVVLINKKFDYGTTGIHELINDKSQCKILSHDLSLIDSVSMKQYSGWFIKTLFQNRYLDNFIELYKIIKQFDRIENDDNIIYEDNILKCGSILDNYKFIYLSLLYNKSFLCLFGKCASGKRFLCRKASLNLGFEFLDVNVTSKDEITSYLIECGINNKRWTFFINIDLLPIIRPNLCYIIKNIIQNEYLILFDEDKIRDISSKYSSIISLDEFKENLRNNSRFILCGNSIEQPVLNRGIIYRMRPVSHEEYILMSCKTVAEVYRECVKFVGEKFIDFSFICSMSKHLYDISIETNNKILEHLCKGIDKIQIFKNNVDVLEGSLNETKYKLKEMNIESENKIKTLIDKKLECEENRTIAIGLAEILNERKSQLDFKKEDIQIKIENATPLIKSAKEEVENINRKALEELKTMNNPPFIVKYTLETVSLVLENSKKVQWEETKKALRNSDFISKIISFDIESMSDQTYNMLKERVEIADWDVKRISKASRAAGPLAKWVNSVLVCHEIYKQVIPLKNEIVEIEKEYIENEKKLSEQNLLVSKLENEIEQNKIDYSNNLQNLSKIQGEIETTESKLKISKKVIEDLTKELNRWNNKANHIKKESENALSNSIIQSIIPIYISLDYNKRGMLLEKCVKIIKSNSLDITFDLRRIFNIEKWIIERFKRFKHFLILEANESEYLPLIEKPYTQVSCCDENFTQVLQTVKNLSGNLIMKDINCCDINVKNEILKEFKNKIDNESEFTIYIISTIDYFRMNNEPEKNIIESVYNSGLVINMKLNHHSFVNYAKNKIIEVLEPELFMAHVNSNENIKDINFQITKNERKLLDRLIYSDIFDPEFLKFIDDYKSDTVKLESDLTAIKRSNKVYIEAVNSKAELIELIGEIYNEVEELGEINSFYRFDFNAIFHFVKILYKNKRIFTDLIVLVFNWINPGIFQSEKIFWGIKALKLLSKRDYEIKEKLKSIDNLYSIESQNIINHLISNYLKTDKFNEIIMEYYDTVILLTDGLQDPVYIAESYCHEKKKILDVYAVGSTSEMNKTGYSIIKSLESGNYVLLKNLHLSKTWINKIETEFVNKHKGIFLTCHKNISLSKRILSSCHKICCEISDLKSLMIHLNKSIKTTLDGHILLKCILIHSIIVLRQLHIPYGWTTTYNFNINDFKMTVFGCTELFNMNSNEFNDLIISIYSAKISSDLDLMLLKDIVKVSDARVTNDYTDLETWLYSNPIENDLSFIGFTSHTQDEIYNINKNENKKITEYETVKINRDYDISCKILENLVNAELDEICSKRKTRINLELHKSEFEFISRSISEKRGVEINFNNIMFPSRLINLYPIIKNLGSEVELNVIIDDEVDVESNISIKAMLYNGIYVKEKNKISSGFGDCSLHTLHFIWINTESTSKAHTIDIPLYNAYGFV